MNYRLANINDWEFLLECRNDPETRLNSINSGLVDKNSHISWLEKTLSNPNRKLYIIENNNDKVGTVRTDFDEESNTFEISWAVAPSQRGMGFGKKMVQLISNTFTGNKIAKIKSGNIASLKIAESLGLTLKEKKNNILTYSNF